MAHKHIVALDSRLSSAEQDEGRHLRCTACMTTFGPSVTIESEREETAILAEALSGLERVKALHVAVSLERA